MSFKRLLSPTKSPSPSTPSKKFNQSDSPPSGDLSFEMGKGEEFNKRMDDLETLIKDCNTKVRTDFRDANIAIRKDIGDLKQMITERDEKFAALEKRVIELESSLKDTRHLLLDRNRYKIRLLSFPNVDAPYPTVRMAVYNFLEETGVNLATIADFQMFPGKQGRQIILTFINTEAPNYLALNAKRIRQQYKIRIAREMSKDQRASMHSAIEKAKEGKTNAKVNVDWVAPAAYVDGQRIWPTKSSNHPQSVSYSTAVTSKKVLPKPYESFKIAEAKSVPISALVSDSIDPVSGHEFFGALQFWDGKSDVKQMVKAIIEDDAMPFRITDRDNVIFAAVSLKDGSINKLCDDGGEKGAGDHLLGAMEFRGIVDGIIVICRKFARFQLGPDRFRLFNNLAFKLMDQIF